MITKLTPNFTAQDVRKLVQKEIRLLEEAILNRMIFIGEEFIKNARQDGTYTDQTGNLRSSIGYVIMKNGLQYTEGGFVLIGEGGEGVKAGEKIIAEVAAKFPTGFVLIVVAGMGYAAAVEAKGYDVLTNSSFKAEAHLKKAIESLKKKF